MDADPVLDADPLDADPPRMQTNPKADSLWMQKHPLRIEGMTHACEIITFPQLLLRAVNMHTTTQENMNYLSSVKIMIQLQDTASRLSQDYPNQCTE